MCPRGRQQHERAIETPRKGLSSRVVQAQKEAGEAIWHLSHTALRIWANPSDHSSGWRPGLGVANRVGHCMKPLKTQSSAGIVEPLFISLQL